MPSGSSATVRTRGTPAESASRRERSLPRARMAATRAWGLLCSASTYWRPYPEPHTTTGTWFTGTRERRAFAGPPRRPIRARGASPWRCTPGRAREKGDREGDRRRGLIAPRTWLGGTYNRSAIATRICGVVLARVAEGAEPYVALAARSQGLVDALAPALAEREVGTIAARGSLVALTFRTPALAELAALRLLTRGIFVRSVGGAQITLFLSLAHGEREIA